MRFLSYSSCWSGGLGADGRWCRDHWNGVWKIGSFVVLSREEHSLLSISTKWGSLAPDVVDLIVVVPAGTVSETIINFLSCLWSNCWFTFDDDEMWRWLGFGGSGSSGGGSTGGGHWNCVWKTNKYGSVNKFNWVGLLMTSTKCGSWGFAVDEVVSTVDVDKTFGTVSEKPHLIVISITGKLDALSMTTKWGVWVVTEEEMGVVEAVDNFGTVSEISNSKQSLENQWMACSQSPRNVSSGLWW